MIAHFVINVDLPIPGKPKTPCIILRPPTGKKPPDNTAECKDNTNQREYSPPDNYFRDSFCIEISAEESFYITGKYIIKKN